ncbi:MAG: LuxR C-terminal-related transcriptional regulator [Bacteroidota bacterium]
MKSKKAVHLDSGIDVKPLSLNDKEKILFYEKVFSKLNAIVFVFDLNNFRMLWVNDAFKKILGYKKLSKAISRELLVDIYHPDDRNYLDEMVEFFRKNKNGTFTAIFQFRDINGKYVWLCTAANVFRRNADRSVFEVVGVSLSFSNAFTCNNNLKVITRQKLKETSQDVIKILTKRERELIRYFAQGHKTRVIAEMFGLSIHTVNNHRKNILRKLGLNNIAELVHFAVEHGLNS